MGLKQKLGELLSPVYGRRRDILLCKDLTVETGPKPSGRLKLEPMGTQHLKALVQFVHEHHADVARSLRMLDDCFRHGYEGRVALLDGRIIGYRWWVTPGMHHPQLKLYGLSLREGEAFAFGLYIARAFRAQGHAGEFLALTQQQLRDQGYKKLYNAVSANNVAARRLYASFGADELATHVATTFFAFLTLSGGRWMRYDPVWM